MYCPKCRSEYREGISRCATCGVELMAELPPDDLFSSPEAMANALAEKDVQPLLVGPHTTMLDAQRLFIKERIATVVARESGGEEEEEHAMHARFYLLVAAEDLGRGREIVERRWHERAQSEGLLVSDVSSISTCTCPACGTQVSESISECPECGLYLGEAEGAAATGNEAGSPEDER